MKNKGWGRRVREKQEALCGGSRGGVSCPSDYMIYCHCVLRSDSVTPETFASTSVASSLIVSRFVFCFFFFCMEAENDVILVKPLVLPHCHQGETCDLIKDRISFFITIYVERQLLQLFIMPPKYAYNSSYGGFSNYLIQYYSCSRPPGVEQYWKIIL